MKELNTTPQERKGRSTMGQVYSIGAGGLQPINDGRKLPAGQVVSYGDMANPRQKAVVTSTEAQGLGQPVVFLEDGRRSHVTQSIIDGPGGWQKENEIMRSSEMANAVAEAEKRRQQLQEQKKQENRRDEVQRDQKHADILNKYPHLTPVEKSKKSPHALGAANIRKELKRAFPGVKFSVRSETFAGGDSIDVRYTDGPKREEVEKITNKYQEGHFDGQFDIYEFNRAVWPRVFGGAKFVNVDRDISESVRRQAAEALGLDIDGRLDVDEHRDIRQKANELLDAE